MDVTLTLANLPRHVPDLRPSADAAASHRQTTPPPSLAMGTVEMPIPAQALAVGQAMLAAPPVSELRAVDGAERRLVPFGIDMLPRTTEDDQSAAGTPDDRD